MASQSPSLLHKTLAPKFASHVDWLRMLSELSLDINTSSDDLADSIDAFLGSVGKGAHVDALAVVTIDDENDLLTMPYAVGLSKRFLRYFNHTDRMRLGRGLIGTSISGGTPARIEHESEWEHIGPSRWITMFKEEGIGALLAAPMRLGDKPAGALVVFIKGEHVFTGNEQFFFAILANHISVLLENARNYRSIERGSKRLKSQVEKLINLQGSFQAINQYLNESTDQALSYLTDYLQKTFGGMGVALFVPNEKDPFLLQFRASNGLTEHFTKAAAQYNLKADDPGSLVAIAYQTKQAQLSPRVFTDDRVNNYIVRVLSDDRLTAEAAFPLVVEDRVFGVLAVYYDHLHEFEEEETSVLGAFSQFLGILFENHRIFASLNAEKQKNESIVYSLQDGLIAYDLEGTIIDANPRALKLLGVEKEKIVGSTSLSSESEDAGVRNVYAVSHLTIPDFEKHSFSVTHPQESSFEVTQVPLRQEGYEQSGSLRIIHDVTAEKRIEQIKTNFVATATHQLRTPLTGIRWGLSSLVGDPKSTLTSEQVDLVKQLEKTTKNVIGLINDLLNVSELEEGKVMYQFELQPIIPVIRAIIEASQVEIEQEGVGVSLEVQDETKLPPVMIDAQRLKMVLQNMIDNAVHYTAKGGAVKVGVAVKPGVLEISIADNGIGISKKDLSLLFNKFFRGENAVRKKTDGSGLGLYLAKGIVENHNGTLRVESELNKGTTFFIDLPTSADAMPKTQSGDNQTATKQVPIQ